MTNCSVVVNALYECNVTNLMSLAIRYPCVFVNSGIFLFSSRRVKIQTRWCSVMVVMSAFIRSVSGAKHLLLVKLNSCCLPALRWGQSMYFFYDGSP